MQKSILAWHFVGETLRDGRPVPKDGEWLEHSGPAVICKSGLHASVDPFDALQYAPGSTLCLVEIQDVRETQNDKLVATRRKILARMDAKEMLCYFARMQALSVVHLWNAPDVVLDWLMTGDESLRADAADAAVRAAYAARAARAAADAAVRAARAAARAATYAARAATYAADAVRAATYAARADFNALVHECFEGPLQHAQARGLTFAR